MPYHPTFAFEGSQTIWDFINDRSFVTGILGPLGSGKSIACCLKIMALASMQEPDRNNIRRSRWAVIRNTYPELKSTTIKTWEECFPENECGPIVYSHPITHRIRKPAIDGHPGLDVEVMFLALDRPADVRHLKSLDLTGAWINEAVEVPGEILDMLTGRVGRYPPVADVTATWAGVILDTNAPDDTNWWYDYAEKGEMPEIKVELPDGSMFEASWAFYRQPPAILEVSSEGNVFTVKEAGFDPVEVKPTTVLQGGGRYWVVNPQAENLEHLRPGYYHQQVANKTLEWIQRMCQAKYVFLADGKPWVPEFNQQAMVRKLKFDENLPLHMGIDCGGGTLNPAAVWGQRGPYGDWRCLAELSIFDIGIDRFSTVLRQVHAERFGSKPIERAWIDPAGMTRDEVYETMVADHLKSRGIPAFPAPTNDPNTRRDALALPMGRMIALPQRDPVPGFMVDPSCTTLIAGLGGKWFRRRVQISGPARYIEKPEKNQWSHVCDAASYLTLGGGEHQMLSRAKRPGPDGAPSWPSQGTVVVKSNFGVFS